MCGFAATPPVTYAHVIWIWFENHAYNSIVGAAGAPYLNQTVGAKCGLATNFHNETHPSLGNYIAATSGSTQGLARDCAPNGCPQNVPSFFGQLEAAGKTWKGYAESMPRTCAPYDTSPYAVRHNPPPYYADIKSTCKTNDVPMGTPTSGALATDLANNTLPSFSFIAPNLCSDMHNCSVATGDSWLKSWLTTITDSPTYRAGRTAVFITWDEGPGGAHGQNCITATDESCHVATYVVGPAVKPGMRPATRYTHYSMLKTTSQLLGLKTYLGNASSAAGMRAGFKL
jgi:hypothetical protein